MHRIKITDALITPCFLAAEMRVMLFQLMQKEIKNYPSLEHDFLGYNYISETFLYHSFGKLCLENNWDRTTFDQKIQIKNLDEDDEE